MCLQAVKGASAAINDHHVLLFSPSQLRQALRTAGNIIQKSEMEAVLAYVSSDDCYEEMHELYLVAMRDGTVRQVVWQTTVPPFPKLFILPRAYEAAAALMLASSHQLVAQSETWQRLAE